MSKVKEFLKNLDRGFYKDAHAAKKSAGQYLAEQVEPEEPEVDRVYQRMLKRYRAEDDGSYRARRVADFAEETAALEKCLRERGIRTAGSRSDRVEKFYSTTTDTALFPAFMSNQIQAGMLDVGLVDELAASDEQVEAHAVEKVSLADTAADRTLKFTGEGANMPKTKIVTAEGLVRLYKYGRVLEYTYEAARLLRNNVIAAFMQRMGAQIAIDETDDLLETLIAGDGTTGSAITDSNDLDAEVSGTTDYDELIRLFLAFPAGYRMTNAVVGDALLRTVLNLAEVRDPQAGYRVLQDGVEEFRMFGATWHRWRSDGAPSFETDNIVAVDRRNAVGILREGDFLEESDRIIDRQLNQTAMSQWVGYQKIDNSATVLYDGTA